MSANLKKLKTPYFNNQDQGGFPFNLKELNYEMKVYQLPNQNNPVIQNLDILLQIKPNKSSEFGGAAWPD